MSSPDNVRPGFVVADRYVIEARKRSGGMSAIYRARDRDGETVAIKILGVDEKPVVERRFLREIEVLRSIRHPTVVRYLDSGVLLDGRRFLVMEWLEGIDLRERLFDGPLEVGETLLVMERIATALGLAHARKIVHRDIKPGNIFLPDGLSGKAKLLDFGIAHAVDASTRLTATGSRFGTPSYMSPEQVRGVSPLNYRTDVYSLGCVMFQCLTGQLPIIGRDIMSVFCRILMDPVIGPAEYEPSIPREVDQLVRKLIAKDPGERLPDGAAVVNAIAELRGHLSLDRATLAVPPVARSTITDHEQQWVNVVMAKIPKEAQASLTEPPGENHDEGGNQAAQSVGGEDEASGSITILRTRISHLGARWNSLPDGSLIVVLQPEEGAQTRTAIDQSVHAARCALLIRNAFPGIDIGLAGGRASLLHKRLVGDVIERARKLLDTASSPGSGVGSEGAGVIRVDASTRRFISNRFRIQEKPDQSAVLIDEITEDDACSMAEKMAPFVGRKREWATIEATLEQSWEDESACALLITGPAGFGKTRLRYELERYLADADVATWLCVGDPLRTRSAFALISQVLRRACGIANRESADIQQQKLRQLVARYVDAADARRVSIFLAELLRAPFTDVSDVQLQAARRDRVLMSDQIRRACIDLFAARTRAGPCVLIIDDVHWGDPSSMQLIDDLLGALRRRPFAVVALGRDGFHDRFPDLWRDHDVVAIQLQRLSSRSAEKLVRSLLGDDAEDARVTRLVEQAGGNPFFLEEMARQVATGEDTLPESVIVLVQNRLDGLDPRARRVLRAASVFGQSFWRGGLLALLLGQVDIDLWLKHLITEQELVARVEESRFAGDTEYLIRNSLIREAAYGTLPDDERKAAHRLAGEWLLQAGETDMQSIAEQFVRSDVPERAIPYFLQAAREAAERSDFDAALELASRGIACGATGEVLEAFRRVEIEERIWRGRPAELLDMCAEAIARQPRGSQQWYDVIGEAAQAAGRLADAERVSELLELVESVPVDAHASTARHVALAKLAVHLLVCGNALHGVALVESLQRELGDLANVDPLVAGNLHFARSRLPEVLDNPAAMLNEFIRCVECFEAVGDLRQACLHRHNIGYAQLQLGLYRDAESQLRAALGVAERLRIDLVSIGGRPVLAMALAHMGDTKESEKLLQSAIDWFEQQGDARMTVWSQLDLVDVYLLNGDVGRAAQKMTAIQDSLADTSALLPRALATEARILLSQGLPAAALERARVAYQRLSEQVVECGEALIPVMYAETLHANGDPVQAREVIERARDCLYARARAIDAPEWRKSFLENIPDHARTLHLARTWGISDPSPDGDEPGTSGRSSGRTCE